MADEERLAALGALLDREPDEHSWEALCYELARWDADARASTALALAAPVVARWPIERPAPRDWVQRVSDGAPIPEIALATSLTFDNVRYKRGSALIKQLLATDVLAGLRSLTISSGIADDGLALLLTSPHLGELTALNLSSGSLSAKGAAMLAAAQLPALRSLDLGANKIGDKAVAALMSAPWLPQLTSLSLSHNNIGAKGIDALASAPLGALRHLALRLEDLSGAGIKALERASSLAGLESLELYADWPYGSAVQAALFEVWPFERLKKLELRLYAVEAAGLDAMARCERLGALEHLKLHLRERATSAILAPLLRSPHISALAALDLSGCGLDDSSMAALAIRDAAPLGALDVGHNTISAAGLAALVASPQSAALRSFKLWGCPIGDAGAVALAASPHMSALRELDLLRTNLSASGVAALAASPYLAALVRLRLSENAIGDAGVAALSGSAHIKGLRELDLSMVGAGEHAVYGLARATSLGALERLNLSSNKDALGRGILALCAAEGLGALRTLDLSSSFVDPVAVLKLFESGKLPKLRSVSW